MHNDGKIRAVVAKFFRVAESEVTESFLFPPERMQGSVARSTLHAALKRMAGVDLPAAFTANSFGELMRAPAVAAIGTASTAPDSSKTAEAVSNPVVSGRPAVEPAVAPSSGASDAGPAGLPQLGRVPLESRADRGLGGLPVDFEVGTDIESAANLSWTGDPWTDPFYLENFTSGEIAYCLRRPDPRLSLCGLWSAKEATIKCMGVGGRPHPKQIEICHDEHGKPYLRLVGEVEVVARGMEFRLSISHAGGLATAVCVCLRTRPTSERRADKQLEGAAAPGTPGEASKGPGARPSAEAAMEEAGKMSVETLAWAGLGLSALSFLLLLIHLARR